MLKWHILFPENMWNTFSVVSKFDIFPRGIRNHFTAMCQSIIKPDLNDIVYVIQ